MKIGTIDIDRDVLVIAEIGNNHEGDMGRAEEMIHRAAEAGAQAVKFQSITPERLVAPDQTVRLAQLKRFEVDEQNHRRLSIAAKQAGVMFMSTPFSLPAVSMLAPLVPAYKIASGDNDFTPLLEKIAATGKAIILSTGMTALPDIARAKEAIEAVWRMKGSDPGLVLLHCASAYPTPAAEANLLAIRTLAQLGRPVGYSDHTLGIDAAVAAVAVGARVIEKHFTLSKTQSEFRDHALSAEPAELREMITRIKALQEMLGDGVKRIMSSEQASASAARRSICAARILPAGHTLALEDLDWLRPSGGMPPADTGAVIGRRLLRALQAGERLTPDALG
jgi:N,N'-diacetyllegionaminate synthase